MVLSWGDDYPIHQTPEPIAYAGTDRNFYDRYFFNGYAEAGDAAQRDFALYSNASDFRKGVPNGMQRICFVRQS